MVRRYEKVAWLVGSAHGRWAAGSFLGDYTEARSEPNQPSHLGSEHAAEKHLRVRNYPTA